jgi:predicted transglutaminase-like cysteine proteinase
MNTSTPTKASKRLLLLSALVMLAGSFALDTPAVAGTHAPLGFQLMCLQKPQECKGGGAASASVDAQTMATLRRVNAKVNRSITPRNDTGADVWNASSSVGDCEDFALAKRSALIKEGLPASSLRIAYVKTRKGVGHAVLVVKTSRGDYVLDNLAQAIKPMSQTGYRIVSMQGANPKKWS